MLINKLWKALLALALVVGLTAAMAAPASADGSITWNGVRGLDSIHQCTTGETAGLHWILTAGGSPTVTGATIHVGAESDTGDVAGNGAVHFFTAGATVPTGAYATYVGNIGRNALLTISSGCYGTPPPPS